jgi:hypothetical protein
VVVTARNRDRVAAVRMLAELARLVRPIDPAALHAANRALWRLEDRVRDIRALREKGRIKLLIDRANLRRHARVADLDAEVVRRWPRGRSRSGYLSSESIGQMLDRGTILVLKRAKVGETAALEHKWSHLLACLERAMVAVRAGRFVHHAVGEIKAYGSG